MVRPANRYYGSVEEAFNRDLTDYDVFKAMASIGVKRLDKTSTRKMFEDVCSRMIGYFPVGRDYYIFDDGRCSVIHW